MKKKTYSCLYITYYKGNNLQFKDKEIEIDLLVPLHNLLKEKFKFKDKKV